MDDREYFDTETTTTILMPIEVKYNEETGMVYSYKPITLEDVEKAIRERDSKSVDTEYAGHY